MAPDGNCLFRSVADQMEGCPMNYATYRKFACDYMVKTRAQFEPFFVPDDEIESFDDYIANMRTNGTWGTQLELKAIADGLERHLVVWQVDQARWMIRSCTVLKAECIHLGYTGGVHYDSVRRLDDSDLDMKPKPLSADGKDVDSERKKDSSKDESKCQFLMKSSCCPNEDHVKRVLLLHNGRVEDALKQLLQEREECEGEWSKTNEVVYSHISTGLDFFDYEPHAWDIIVSNPPFTNKRKYFERALSFGKPFALIMTNTWLNDSAPKQLFKDKDLQLLMFDKRMKFISPDGRNNDKITFSSSYYCWNFLPKQIIMEELQVTKKKVSQEVETPLTKLLS